MIKKMGDVSVGDDARVCGAMGSVSAPSCNSKKGEQWTGTVPEHLSASTPPVPEHLSASTPPTPMYPPVGSASGSSIFKSHPPENTIARLLEPSLFDVLGKIFTARQRQEKMNHAVLLASVAQVLCSSDAKTPPLQSQEGMFRGDRDTPTIDPEKVLASRQRKRKFSGT